MHEWWRERKKSILDQGFRWSERGKNNTLNSAKNDCQYSDVLCHDDYEKLKNETIYGSIHTPHAYKTAGLRSRNYEVWPVNGLFSNSFASILNFDSEITQKYFFKNLTENETKSHDVSEHSAGKGASGGAAFRDKDVPLLTTDASHTYSRD